jgi:hypothetical protein
MTSSAVRQDAAEILFRLSEAGATLSPQHKAIVKDAGLIPLKRAEKDIEALPTDVHLWLYEVPVIKEGPLKGQKMEGLAYFDRIPEDWKYEWKDKEILDSDWRIPNPKEPDAELRSFIDSHIPSFSKLKAYKRFWLYCEQARRLEETARDYADVPLAERYDWKKAEYIKIRQNKLYGLNRYITIKEDGKMGGGRRKYKASGPQALLAFLVDSGFSFDLVKGRQAAITSTMMAIAALEIIVTPSYNGVFIVHKKDGTGKKLFKDKLQSTLQHFPAWMRAAWEKNSGNWSAERVVLDFDGGEGKMNKGRDTSEFLLLGSDDSMTVNGQTPSRSFFDEAQNNSNYQTMLGEIDPTMYQFNERTGTMDMVRAIYGWGTGSSNNTGKGSFEAHYKVTLEAWQTHEPTYGWVPLFMDWTCRPGMTKAHYAEVRDKYLRGRDENTKGLSPKERLALFKAHYPSDPDDAFMATHKTLIPLDDIIDQQRWIKENVHDKGLKPVPGRFVPIFDESKPQTAGSMFPFAVRGVMWEELSADDMDAPVRMMFHPEKLWLNRYYQGTDPIQNDGGFSRFSSAIWDAVGTTKDEDGHTLYHPTVACMLNARSPYPQELFTQSILMGMYYANHGQRACKEIVEINQGHRYVETKCGPIFNLKESLVPRGAMTSNYNGGTHTHGVDLKSKRKSALYHDVVKMLQTHRRRIYYYEFWSQVRHIDVEDKGDTKGVEWGTQNKNVYNDDMVYAVGYSELCASTCQMRDGGPRMLEEGKKEYKRERVLERDPITKYPRWVYKQKEVTYR